MNAVNQYLSQFGGAQVAGPALRSANRPTSGGRDLENAGGGVNPMSGDYNGDGRVDGADLGLALGGGQNSNSVINNWSAPYSVGGPAFLRTTPGQQGGQGGVYVGGSSNESPSPTLGGAAGGAGRPGVGSYGGNRPRGASPAGGAGRPTIPGGSRGGFGKPEYAGPGAPGGVFGSPESAGPGAPISGFGSPEYAGGGAPNLPPLSDLNGDGRIDGSDLGLYMIRYGYAPPGYGQNQNQPNPGQPGGYTPSNIGGYSPSGFGANRGLGSGPTRRKLY